MRFDPTLLFTLLVSSAVAAQPIGFNHDIRPILAESCFHCHGPDPGTRKAGLRLDTEAGFFTAKDGEQPTVIKSKPDVSNLFQRLISKDADELMPPPDSHKKLKPEQIALVKEWIAQGAPWQPHWSLIQPQAVPPPQVKDSAWVKTPVDRFILAKLEAAGLKPNAQAEAHALIRRVALDLTGLPPSPELVARYAPKNDAPMADATYSALVDELLKSPAYGEHRARYWLDAARYADTHGLHFDKEREIWPYRDWVVKAFNRNEPFDQFTVEQIAGDLLTKPTNDQLIATGFQRCNITTNEGGTIDEENLANYASDRVQTLGWVYMGLTTNCSQCHDHKFDPITQRDYYSLAAFFRNTTQKAKDGNVKDGLGPILVLPTDKDRPRWNALPAEIATAQTQQNDARKAAKPLFDLWLASAKPADLDKDEPTKGIVAHVPLNEGTGNEVSSVCGNAKTFKATGEVTWKPDGKLGPAPVMKPGSTFEIGDVGDYEKDHAFSYGAWVRAGSVTAISGSILARMDEKNGHRGWDLFQSDNKLTVHIVSKWPEDAIKVTTAKPALRPNVWQHVFVTYDGKGKAGSVRMYVDGIEAPTRPDINALKGSIKTPTPTRIGQRSNGAFFMDGGVQDVRIYDRQLTAPEVMTLAKVGPLRTMLAAKKHGPKQQAALFEHFLLTRDPAYEKALASSNRLTAEQTAIKTRSPLTHIQEERMDSKPMANVLMRGQYDKVGDAVEAAVPVSLGKLPAGAPQNRLGLAKWLVSKENPLTARVTVNRFWQELFGTGLVKTSEDFGIMGSPPSHPELLDWLAVEFRDSGWDVKRLFKLLVSSAAYRQAAILTPEKIEKDRDDALLSRGPRFRMDAEMIRDYALAVSSTLSPKMGGPGTMPYQPVNVWEVVGMGTEKYKQDNGENLYRRTIYNFWKRTAPSPNMEVFNAPPREVSCVRRDRTNTPLQALVTMNDPQFIEAARNLAQHTLENVKGDDTAKFTAVAERLLCRPLKAQETQILTASLADLRKFYTTSTKDAEALLTVGETKADEKLPKPELAAWTMLCNQLMNLDEVLNK
jgi:hypothetical protein